MSQLEHTHSSRLRATRLIRFLCLAAVALGLMLALRGPAPARAAFPGANGRIAFMSLEPGYSQVYAMDPDGANVTNLSSIVTGEGAPNWSADGSRIAYESFANGGGKTEIWVMDAGGGNKTQLTSNTAFDSGPAWSPDGSKVAFHSDRSGDYEIWVMDADGNNPVNLTNDPAGDSSAAWSPDGTRIAFASSRTGNADIWLMDPDGANLVNLTNDNTTADFDPDWSPDGTQIVFTSARGGTFDIWVMNADGSNPVNLTNGDGGVESAWSPDGTQIAFASSRDGGADIFVMDADGSNPTNLTATSYAERTPNWQPLPIYLSTSTTGVTDDAVVYGPHDVLKWQAGGWTKWFDGTAAGLVPNGKAKHNINAIWIPDTAGDDAVMSFAQNARFVPGIVGKVDGMDLVWWDGLGFALWFDGQDVGLTNKSQEKIDALHVLDGALSPVGGGCLHYLLISTQGPGQVPGVGGPIRYSGEDVLGFCMTSSGASTTGFWHLLLDGSAEGMPRNSTASLSASPDGQTLYLTTRGVFNVDSASGGHSMLYQFNMLSGQFRGPTFVAADQGVGSFVDALQR